MNALLLAAVLTGLIGSAVLVVVFRRRRPALARGIGRAAFLLAVVYVGALAVASLASRPVVLPVGDREAFCGFYLDCHLGVAVERAERRQAVGDGAARVEASGMFHVVTLRVSSDARQATLHLGRPDAVVIDAQGRTFGRDRAAEAALTGSESGEALARPVEAGGSFPVTLVFDLPPDAAEPRLRVRDPHGIDRVLEALLIGDTDSAFHPGTTHALTPSS